MSSSEPSGGSAQVESAPEAERLYAATLKTFADAHLEVAIRDPESRSVVSKWHLIDPSTRHRFTVVVQSLEKSSRGKEQVSLYVQSHYQTRTHSPNVRDEGDWQEVFQNRAFALRSKRDESSFAQVIQRRYLELKARVL